MGRPSIFRILAGILTAVPVIVAFAQEAPVFQVPVRVVSAPTAVVTKDGKPVKGLEVTEVRLFDNDRLQKIHLEYLTEPVSIAIVVQNNEAAGTWLPHVRRMASLVEAQLMGETGEASLTVFGDDVKAVQSLTSDGARLEKAFRTISSSGKESRCLDAIAAAAKQLEGVSARRRRVILLVAQAGDIGSATHIREIVDELDRNNISVFSLVMPRVGKDLVQNTLSLGNPAGATGRADSGAMASVDLGKLIPELSREAKAVIRLDEISVLTGELDGAKRSFRGFKELEQEVSAVGEELHTEYVLTYTPDRTTPGYHRIRVEVDRPHTVVRSRPGYYVFP